MRIRVEDCDDAAFAKIIPLLRAEDVEEWRSFAGDTPSHLVRAGWKLPVGDGVLNRIAYGPSGRPLLVWGVNPFQAQYNIPPEPNAPGWVWLVATDEAYKHAKSLHHLLVPEFREVIVPLYSRLITASAEGNTAHHEWLRWLGFTQAFVPMPMGIHGAPFIPFTYLHTKDTANNVRPRS